MPLTPEQTKRAFLSSIPRMRSEFAYRFADFRGRIFHSDYMRTYAAEVLRLTGDEMRARHQAAEQRMRRLLDSGWRPSLPTEIRAVYTECFAWSDYRQDPFSDLYERAKNTYSDIGQPEPEPHLSPVRLLGDIQVQASQEAVLNLETYIVVDQQQPTEDPRQAFRIRVLKVVDERLHSAGGTWIQAPAVLLALEMSSDRESWNKLGSALRYWISRGAIEANDAATLDDGTPLIAIKGITGLGYDILENRPTAAGGSTIVHATSVGVVGTMSGGVVNQTAGAAFADLVSALEKMRELSARDESEKAAIVESAVDGALAELRSAEPNVNKLRRLFGGISEAIQTLGELGPAWALVAAEAARLGIPIALPPGFGH